MLTLTRVDSVIPHVFGRGRPIVIDNIELLKRELELVDALGDMEIATQLISSTVPKDPTTGEPVNPLDANFRSLALSRMDPVPRSSKEFAGLQAYTRDTHGATHRHYAVEVLNAFRVERDGETKAWEANGFRNLADGERMLLWHGSRTTNFAGILKQGLRIAPPEGRFGPGFVLCALWAAENVIYSPGYWVHVWQGRVLCRCESSPLICSYF